MFYIGLLLIYIGLLLTIWFLVWNKSRKEEKAQKVRDSYGGDEAWYRHFYDDDTDDIKFNG